MKQQCTGLHLKLGDMERAMIERHLHQAEEHAALGERHIDQQRWIVAKLKSDGQDTAVAKELLDQFEELQALHTDHRDRLRRKLAELTES